MKMEFAEPHSRRSSEPRFGVSVAHNGCLLKNYFNMRKRSVIRTESEDSGFSLSLDSSCEPVMPTIFDAEKVLEELGFAGATDPLIPDRFIPSLMHRISDMPDEVMVKLDTRVWKSIDTFTKKDHVSLLFTSSCLQCDLCMKDLQRSYSCPATLPQEIFWPNNNSNAAARVESWLSRFPDNALLWEGTAVKGTKANIGHIGNQSSTESGILSIMEGDEDVTPPNNTNDDSFGEFHSSQDRADDSGLLVPCMESSKASSIVGKSETIQGRTPPATQSVCEEPGVNTTTIISSEISADDQNDISSSENSYIRESSVYKQSPVPGGRRSGCVNHNAKIVGISDVCQYQSDNQINPDHIDRIFCYSESVSGNVNPIANPGSVTAKDCEGEISDLVNMESNLGRHSLKKMSTDGQLFLLLQDLEPAHGDAVNNHICSESGSNDCHCLNRGTDLKRTQTAAGDTVISPVSTQNHCDATQFDMKMKRHSFDAAFASSAAERRKRFRLAHAKSQNFLFERQDDSHSQNSTNEITTEEITPCDDHVLYELHEEVKERQSSRCREVHSQDNGPHDASGHTGSTECDSSETYHIAGNIEHVDSCKDSLHSESDSESFQEEVHVGPTSSYREESSHEYNSDRRDTSGDTRSNEDETSHTAINIRHVDTCNSLLSLQEVQDMGSLSSREVHSHEQSDISVHIRSNEVDSSSNIKQVDVYSNSIHSQSDSESSEQYFSCDEIFPEFSESSAEETCACTTKHCDVGLQVGSDSFAAFPLSLSSENLNVPVTNMSQTFSKENDRYCDGMYVPSRTFDKENFMLNKILRHSLKLSVLGPITKMTKRFTHGNHRFRNDTEYFSQSLNSEDCMSSPKAKILERNMKSSIDSGWTSSDVVLKSDARVKSIMSDNTAVGDNDRLRISKPFVRNQSLRSDMFSPKCEVRLMDYNGSALFWSGRRNIAENEASCNSGLDVSMHLNSTGNRKFTSGIHMAINSGNEITNGKLYFTEVYLEVNGEKAGRIPPNQRCEENISVAKLQTENGAGQNVQDEILKSTKVPTNTENPCGRALRDLEDLRIAIQKAKEARVSASRELKLLQELLKGSDNEDDEMSSERIAAGGCGEPTFRFPVANRSQIDETTTQALSELQQKPAKDTSQDKEFWEGEIKKAKEEISQVCQAKLNAMEEKLRAKEDELALALDENVRLKDQLELSAAFPVCKCNVDAHKSDTHMNGISDADATITSLAVKPSISTKNFWQEWYRLQSDLMKAERKTDELNILLSIKVMELNKMQMTLSKQTMDMILLEEAYFQLRRLLSKRKLNKSASSHLSRASPTTEAASDTSSKVSDPEIPP